MPVLICCHCEFVGCALGRIILVHEADIDVVEWFAIIVYDPDLPARAC